MSLAIFIDFDLNREVNQSVTYTSSDHSVMIPHHTCHSRKCNDDNDFHNKPVKCVYLSS